MKKMFLMAAALILAAGMAFAGGGGQKQAAGGAAPAATASGPITLNLWHIYEDQSRGVPIADACKRFEAANPGVKVAITTAANDPYKTKLKTVTGDDFPDVFHSWGGGWLKSFVDAGYVADMTAEANAAMSQLNPALVTVNQFNGKIYGVPYTAGTTILYYNKAIFDKYNLKAPATFADLDKICSTLIANGIIPFAEANKTMWPGAQHWALLAMRIGGGDIFTRVQNKQAKFTDPEFTQAAQMVIDMVNKGWFPAGVNGLDWDTGQSRIMFYQEQAAMLLSTGGFMGTCKNENADFYNNKLGIALYPAVDGGKGKATDILAGENAWSVSAKSKNVDMAKKLAIFLATDQQEQQSIMDNGILAAKPGLAINSPIIKQAMDQLANATYLQNYVDQTLSPEMGEAYKSATQGLFGLTMTAPQVGVALQKLFDSQN